jgi:hypothetical protein
VKPFGTRPAAKHRAAHFLTAPAVSGVQATPPLTSSCGHGFLGAAQCGLVLWYPKYVVSFSNLSTRDVSCRQQHATVCAWLIKSAMAGRAYFAMLVSRTPTAVNIAIPQAEAGAGSCSLGAAQAAACGRTHTAHRPLPTSGAAPPPKAEPFRGSPSVCPCPHAAAAARANSAVCAGSSASSPGS